MEGLPLSFDPKIFLFSLVNFAILFFVLKEILNKSKTEAEDIIKSSRNSIEKEREEIKKEMSSLLIDLVSAATDKALLNIGKQENQKKLVETAILQSLKESKIEMDEKK